MSKVPHKHAEVIKAWADGATIQTLLSGSPKVWQDTKSPSFYTEYEYRVKPETVVVKYRRYLSKGNRVYALHHDARTTPVDLVDCSHFSRWIDTDWQTVEV